MGSSSSRLGSHPSSNHPNQSRPNRSILSSLVCGGGYSSRATLQVGEHQGESLARNGQYFDRGNDPVQNEAEDSSMISRIGAGFDFPNTEIGSSSQTVVPAGPGTYVGEGFRNAGTSNLGKCLSASKELVSHSVSAGCNRNESSRDNSSAASTTFKEQEQYSSNPVFVNSSANMDVVNGSADKNASQARHLFMRPSSSSSSHGIVNSGSDDNLSIENPVTEVVAHRSTNADVGSVHVSDIPLPLPSRRSDSLPETIPSGLGFLMSNREQSRENETEVHVDIMSISSNFLSSTNGDMSSRESRRNGRRLFWDAFSRRSSRRFNDSPSILSSTDDTEDLGFHDRWLLGLSGDLDEQSGADSGHQVNRTPNLSERRRHTRSEVWERLRGGLDGNGHRGTTCPTGIHPRGMCSCSSFLMTEESSARASISRIVMLAEALFEVLDEIHRQPVSLSLSVVSVPAPASVVDSFPLKSHTKLEKLKHVDDVEQCYICLAEYEEGDKIRVLPCHHEYHMSCVDKWLKEIHGVCPLCRGDVCEGLKDNCSVTNSEISSI